MYGQMAELPPAQGGQPQGGAQLHPRPRGMSLVLALHVLLSVLGVYWFMCVWVWVCALCMYVYVFVYICMYRYTYGYVYVYVYALYYVHECVLSPGFCL